MVDTDDTQRTTDDRRRTTPRVWHKLPTGELKRQTIGAHDGPSKVPVGPSKVLYDPPGALDDYTRYEMSYPRCKMIIQGMR